MKVEVNLGLIPTVYRPSCYFIFFRVYKMRHEDVTDHWVLTNRNFADRQLGKTYAKRAKVLI